MKVKKKNVSKNVYINNKYSTDLMLSTTFIRILHFFAREPNAKQSNGYWILQEYCLQKTPNSINRIVKYDVINSNHDIIVGDFEVDKLFLSGLLSGQSLLLVPVLDLN